MTPTTRADSRFAVAVVVVRPGTKPDGRTFP